MPDKLHVWMRWLATCVVVLTAAAGVHADAIKFEGQPWVQNVRIQSIGGGEIVYLAPAGTEVRGTLDTLEAIRMTIYPQMEQAQAALEAGDAGRAVELLQELRRQGRDPWVQHYARRELVGALERQGQAEQAMQAYLELLEEGVDPYFLTRPPLEAVQTADEAQRQRVRELLTPRLEAVEGETHDLLEQMLEASGTGAIEAAEPDAMATQTAPADADAAAPALDESAVVLPAAAPLDHPIANLLRQGRFQEAIQAADQALSTSGDLASSLYFKGRAQLELAEQSGDQNLYKDAGLNFVRVMTYFGDRSLYGTPALLEAAYVHERIGEAEVARELFSKAAIRLDPETDPAYYQRYLRMIGGDQETQTTREEPAEPTAP